MMILACFRCVLEYERVWVKRDFAEEILSLILSTANFSVSYTCRMMHQCGESSSLFLSYVKPEVINRQPTSQLCLFVCKFSSENFPF